MNTDFRFGKYDFTPIEDTIRTYYPIENPEKYDDKNVYEFPGFEKLNEVINDNFDIQKHYSERWVKFKNFLKLELKKPVQETMSAFHPCYSGKVVLKKEKNTSLVYRKELHFYISLLGPYYSIIGLDSSEILLEHTFSTTEETRLVPYRANHAITVSPFLEYEEQFTLLQEKIVEYFPDYKFVPFKISMRNIPGTSLFEPYNEDILKDSVFYALFRPDDIFNTQTRGDNFFGALDWLKVKKLNKIRLEQIREDFLKKSDINKSDLTLHKVWKLQTTTRLPSTQKNGGASITLDSIQVLDLSDATSAVITTEENEEPSSTAYSIINDEIRFDHFTSDAIMLIISDLTINQLKVIVRLNVQLKDDQKLEGDVFELIYIPY